MDAKYDYLANYLNEVGIDMVVPAEVKSEEVIFDANLSALIALLGKYAMENILVIWMIEADSLNIMFCRRFENIF